MSDTLFARKLRAYRKLKSLTQVELAENLGVSVAIVGSLERATRTPTRQLVVAISRVLDVTEEELFGADVSNPDGYA